MQNRCRKRWVNLMISSIFVSFCGHTKTHFGSSQPRVCFFHHQSLKSPLPYHRTPAEGPTWPCGLPCSSAASAASSTLRCCTFYSVFLVSKEGTEEGAKRRKHRGRAYTVLVLICTLSRNVCFFWFSRISFPYPFEKLCWNAECFVCDENVYCCNCMIICNICVNVRLC